MMIREAYLDIETTGLSPRSCHVTVVGIYLVEGASRELMQITGGDITAARIINAIEGVKTIYTYNGERFDLPFIRDCFGIDLSGRCNLHRDLMYECWKHRLYGGLKKVEVQLGIKRQVEGVDGREAVLLWMQYCQHNDLKALDTLLKYNAEDVFNLKLLREKLDSMEKGFS